MPKLCLALLFVLNAAFVFSASYPRKVGISGGERAAEDEFPFMVAITVFKEANKMHATCSGTLISENHVLTAGHCCYDRVKWSVGFGSTRFSTPKKAIVSTKAVVHEKYNKISLVNDVCIVFLPEKVTGYPIINLALKNFADIEKREATVIGFGDTNVETDIIKYLKKGSMKVVDNSICLKDFSDVIVRDTTLCAIGAGADKAQTCEGDSGGALVIKDGKKFVQVGVCSFTYKKCQNGKPSGYARVADFAEWIEKNAAIKLS